jgi:hypothetical protein
MGILDDAIREHLELKRLRGADPDEVSRLEREALGPPHRRSDSSTGAPRAVAHDEDFDDAPAQHSAANVATSYAHDDYEEYEPPRRDLSTTAQDTEEVDMQAELHAEPFDHAPDRPSSGPFDGHAGPEHATHEPASEAEPGDGDVLEETPDFLAEAPEHDRLWFEQRPPRDFDFDK